jgi:hypothetical protein
VNTVVIQGKDFTTVHNTLCELRTVQERLTGVISNSLADQLQAVIKGFEQGLADAYEQDNEVFESKMDYYSEFQSENRLKTIWSIFDLPVHGFLEDHPYTAAREISYKDHWGKDAVCEPIMGPTWGDLYRAADAAIRKSGDDHHIFIEHFYTVAEQPRQLKLTTGS